MYANFQPGRRVDAQLGNTRGRSRQLGAAPAGASGDVVTVGGDVVTADGGLGIRADDTGSVWKVLDVAGTGWVGVQPPVTRGAVRGIVNGPYVIGMVQAASTYRGGERGTTQFQSIAQSYTMPAPDLGVIPALVDSATNPNSPGWNATVNVNYWPAFAAELQRRRAAGLISEDVYQHAMTLKDDPVKAQQNAFWLPPGGGDVPLVLQGGAVTDTGSIHPDALTPEAQARLAEVLAYTAKQRGTSYQEEAQRVADSVRAANPGETFPGVEKYLAAMQSGTLAELTDQEATNTFPLVDYSGSGYGSEYNSPPAGGGGSGSGKLTGSGSSGPLLNVAGLNVSPTMLALAGLGLLLVVRPESKRRRR